MRSNVFYEMGCPEPRSSTFWYPPPLHGRRPLPMLSKLLLMWLLLGCMLKANILGSASPAHWPTGFNASPKPSHHKSMLGYILNPGISQFDFLAL